MVRATRAAMSSLLSISSLNPVKAIASVVESCGIVATPISAPSLSEKLFSFPAIIPAINLAEIEPIINKTVKMAIAFVSKNKLKSVF